MQNIEFKAELREPVLADRLLRTLNATHIATLHQTDTYFRVPNGRLKKRVCAGEPTEIIFYERTNKAQPRLSHFTIYTEQQARERFGSMPMPIWLEVVKKRELYMLGNVRIHLDEVMGLGFFIEFEALVGRGCPTQVCRAKIQELRGKLAPIIGEPIAVGYSDLLALDLKIDAFEHER